MAKKKSTRRSNDSLEKALEGLQSAFGSEFPIGKFGNMPYEDADKVSTGSVDLDRALEGGVPRGRIIEITGDAGVGKSTLSLSIINQIQLLGGTAAFIDVEQAISVKYAKKIVSSFDDVIFCQPTVGEDAWEVAASLANTGEIDCIVMDSVAALVPRDELDGMMGDSLPGIHARLVSQGIKKVFGACQKNDCMFIMINQQRSTIGGYGASKVSTGGNAPKYYNSVKLEVHRLMGGQNKWGDEIVSEKRGVKVLKSKVSSPHESATFNIKYNIGIDRIQDVIDFSSPMGYIERGGAWYSLGSFKGQGQKGIYRFLEENPKIVDFLYQKVSTGELPDEESKKELLSMTETKKDVDLAKE
jgi:recombination protein RecA